VTSAIFAKEEPKPFGSIQNHRYHMPLLPGEQGTKAGGDWVPRGLMRTTNLCGAIVESRALNIWEQEQALIGLALSPSLYEKLCLAVHRWQAEGVDFSRIRDFPEVRLLLTGFPNNEAQSIIGQAKERSGANEAREAGTNRHTAWEVRAATGQLIGTPEMQQQILAVEALLTQAGLERVTGLSERTIRNTVVNCAGRFDDILLERATGRLLVADLKTKRRKFYSWLEVDAQLAIYAYAEWMLAPDGCTYEEGPLHYVDLTEAVVLHSPSNSGQQGAEVPYLRRADLTRGWRIAQLARQVVDERAGAKNVERMALSHWLSPTQKNLEVAS
jgi:hypothetical protein